MESLSSQFTFTNKENAKVAQKPGLKSSKNGSLFNPNNKSSNTENVIHGRKDAFKTPNKRVPLGGKDKNAFDLNSSVKKRSWRLRTPKKKLNVLIDDDNDNDKVAVFNDNDDDEIEIIPDKDPELEDKPLNYEPFTTEELINISKISSTRLEDLSNLKNDIDINEEYPLSFNEEKPKEIITVNPHHFMEPTFVSNAKRISRENSFTEGLSTAELYRLIDE